MSLCKSLILSLWHSALKKGWAYSQIQFQEITLYCGEIIGAGAWGICSCGIYAGKQDLEVGAQFPFYFIVI